MSENDKLSARLDESNNDALATDISARFDERYMFKRAGGDLLGLEERFNERVDTRGILNKEYSHVLDYILLKSCEVITEHGPRQGERGNNVVVKVANIFMDDYKGELTEEYLLSNRDKAFMPQPGMLEYWAQKNGFSELVNHGETLNEEDVAGKYVLTYYRPFSKSWIERDTDDLADVTNKHWYSHTKSCLYDENGNPIHSSNAEIKENDDKRDATVYVPHDSVSYVIDYEKLGLEREDIDDGLAYLHEGINVMDPNLQQVIFRMRKCNLSRDDIISLWQNKVDFSNSENVDKIEKFMQGNGDKEDIMNLNLTKNEDNKYQYNLQDYSCAIQPTSPVLFATAAKIDRDGLDKEQAEVFRRYVGLYNIYDEEGYGEINKEFYNEYAVHVEKEAKKELNVLEKKVGKVDRVAKVVFAPTLAVMDGGVDYVTGLLERLDDGAMRDKVKVGLDKVKSALRIKSDTSIAVKENEGNNNVVAVAQNTANNYRRYSDAEMER